MMSGTTEHRNFMRPLFPQAFELFYAISEGTLEEVQRWLEAGQNPNAGSTSGTTPIMLAIRSSLALPKAELLLSYGATIDVWDKYGMHPIHWVTGSSYDYSLERLAWLLQHGVDPNAATLPATLHKFHTVGWTPLHIAAERGFFKATELLLQHQASVHHKDEHGATALHVSVVSIYHAYKKLVRALLDYGADPNAQDDQGNTPLHLLASGHRRYRKTVIQLLLSRKARLDLTNQEGNRPGEVVQDGFPATEAIRKLLNYNK